MAKRVPWSQNAILFRTNQQSRPLETALRTAGVRYHLIGGQSFFDRREIKDFLAYVKLFVNPNDDISLLRVANVPARGLSDVTMERLIAASHERNCSVFAAMRHTDVQASFVSRTRESIQSFLELVETQRSKLHTRQISSLAGWARTFLEEIGYAAEIRRSEKTPEAADNRLENLRELTDTLPETVVDPEQQLLDFLE